MKIITAFTLAYVLVSVFTLPTYAQENESENPAVAKAENTPKPAAKKIEQEGPLSMSVMGTQDAPNVLYIVPWKTVDAIPAEPYASSLLDEVFAPIDPVEFERSIRIHDQIRARSEPAAKGR